MQPKKIPLRRCCGCGESFPKKELIRVVRTPDGTVQMDFTGKLSGRGVYVCRSLSCFKKARKARRFEGSLECSVPEEVYERMEKELSELCSSLEGVGKCKVSLSFSKGRENSYKNGMLTESKPPVVLGVAVACRGADSQRVRAELTELFTALFDIPSTRVAILKLN